MEEKFKRYVEIQFSGMYNMIMDARIVMEMMDVGKDDYFYIQGNYGELIKEYPNAYEEGKRLGKEMYEVMYN